MPQEVNHYYSYTIRIIVTLIIDGNLLITMLFTYWITPSGVLITDTNNKEYFVYFQQRGTS